MMSLLSPDGAARHTPAPRCGPGAAPHGSCTKGTSRGAHRARSAQHAGTSRSGGQALLGQPGGHGLRDVVDQLARIVGVRGLAQRRLVWAALSEYASVSMRTMVVAYT